MALGHLPSRNPRLLVLGADSHSDQSGRPSPLDEDLGFTMEGAS